jgi:hypothetical protein
MIRTEAVQLTTIKGLAYKQKLYAGGAGITIITADDTGVFTINKRDGTCVPYGKADEEIFTAAVTAEALSLTRSLPYKKLDLLSKASADDYLDEIPLNPEAEVEFAAEDEEEAEDVIESIEYKEFIAQYTDKTDKFSYQLMNKDLMQFAAKSTVVSKMIANKADEDTIVQYIIRSKAAALARNKGMTDSRLIAFIDTFDSMNTRSAFKELKAYLRGKLSKSGK